MKQKLFGLLIVSAVIWFCVPSQYVLAANTYYTSGSKVFEPNGQQVVLLGANIESSLIYLKNWQSGKSPFTQYADPTFQVMTQNWHMNTLRMSISRAIYNLNKAQYLADVTKIVQNANAHGLFVILALHDDNKSGSLFPTDTPTTLDLAFWQDVVSQFNGYSMVGYDLFNEPKWVNSSSQADWNEWLNGGASITDSNGQTYQEVGLMQLVHTVRTISPTQPIIVEPGDASGKGNGSEGGWSNFPAADVLPFPDIIYSEHEYDGVLQGTAYQNPRWSTLLGNYPLFYGEWAVLPNSYQPAQCLGMSPGNADQIANSFMSNAASIGAGWTAWAFDVPHMIADNTHFTPTQMGPGTNWTCPASPNDPIGMGADVKAYLSAFQQPGGSSGGGGNNGGSGNNGGGTGNGGGGSSGGSDGNHASSGSSGSTGNASASHASNGSTASGMPPTVLGMSTANNPLLRSLSNMRPVNWLELAASVVVLSIICGALYLSGWYLIPVRFGILLYHSIRFKLLRRP